MAQRFRTGGWAATWPARLALAVAVVAVAALAAQTSARAAPTWQTSVTLSQPERQAIGIQVGFAASGTAYAAWVEQATRPGTPYAESVRTATRAPSGAWSAPVELSRAGDVTYLQLAVSPSGRALANWQFGVGPDASVEAAYRVDGWSSYGDPTGGTAKGGLVDVAVDDVGNGVAVWTDDYPKILRASYRAVFSSAWTPPVELESARTVHGATVVLDAAGNSTAMWSAYGEEEVGVLKSARRSAATGTWTAPVRVATFTNSLARPSVKTDGQGNVLAVWVRIDGERYVIESAQRAADSEQWSAPVEISAPLRMALSPRLAVSPAGDAVAVWSARPDGTTPVVQSAARAAGAASWSGPVDVSVPARDELFPEVAVDQRGNAVAVWQRFDGTRSVVQASLRPALYGRWLAPRVLGSGAGPRIELDRNGNGLAAWNSARSVHVTALTASGPIVTGLSVPRRGHTGRPIPLTGSATPWAHPLAGEPRWDFGDGRGTSGASATASYARPGTYTVTLTQTDTGGGATRATGTIEITAPPEPLLVSVGRGIGAVRLGQTRTAVVRAYGAPMTEAFARYPNRRPGRVVRYPRPNGTLIVGYHGDRVVLVATTSARDRTARGVGPGSPRRAAARLAGFRPSAAGYTRRARGTTTTFTVPGRTVTRVSIARTGFARS